ncbi:MAG: restriction endonuclease subunit S, partial [Gammaproteobacteria bacterium]|nr:restriction endonuclease subunit S [Gammaproteobacteria bacterium]
MSDVPEGYRMSEVGVIPEDWDVKSFGEICKVNQGLQIAIEDRLKHPAANSKIYITIQYLNNGKDIEYINNYSDSVCCAEEDILMTRTGNTGMVITGVNGVFHNNFFKINLDKKQVDRIYVIYYLKANKTQRIILLKAGTSTIPDLNHNDFYSIRIPLPQLPEQQAIASALSDVDALITALEQLITKKRNIKQGAMQQLLTGEKRLPGFSGEWEVKKLEELCSFTQGVQIPQSEQIKFQKEGYIRYLYIRDFFSEDFEWYVKNTFPDKIMNEKDIMMVNTGNTAGMVYSGAKGVLSNNAFRIKFEEKKIFRDFLFLFLTNPSTQLWIKSFFNSAGQPHVGHKNIAQVKILLPPFPEQQAITQILGDMDTEIESLEQKRDKYKAIKQGMMQELLT